MIKEEKSVKTKKPTTKTAKTAKPAKLKSSYRPLKELAKDIKKAADSVPPETVNVEPVVETVIEPVIETPETVDTSLHTTSVYQMELDKQQQPGFYVEDNKVILTRDFLLKQGKCCGNGCKNCPYK
jgi:hypothetical protein